MADHHFTCGHRRPVVSTWLGQLSDRQLLDEVRLGGTATERGMAADEWAARRRPCRACAALYRRNSHHWSALALGFVLALLVVCAAATGSCSATASSNAAGCP